VKASFANDPFGGLHSAEGESFAIARGMAERDGVSGGIEANFMCARDHTGTIRANVHAPRVPGLAQLIHQL
jgi:hypothetical protein